MIRKPQKTLVALALPSIVNMEYVMTHCMYCIIHSNWEYGVCDGELHVLVIPYCECKGTLHVLYYPSFIENMEHVVALWTYCIPY